MVVNIGDVIESEYGRGKIVAITKQWIVHEEGDHEVAIPIQDCHFWVPAEPGEQGTAKENLVIVTVGRPVTRPPPQRSRRAEFPHRAPQRYSLRT